MRPLSIELNLASWGLLSHVTVYDDGTYGDLKENDGIFGVLLSSQHIPKQGAYVDVQFVAENATDVYGRLNLP